MIFTKRPVIFGISLLGVGAFILSYACRKRLSYYIWLMRCRKYIKKEKSIHIISKYSEWQNIADIFCSKAKAVNALGFDCEWIQINGKKRPVALMQLATYSGMCVLVRLNHLKEDIPTCLRDILEDNEIVKVGVGTDIDQKYLLQDYNINVNGWLDLRHLAVENLTKCSTDGEQVKEKLGLDALATKYLGKKMNKDWRVRMGDWEADKLANIQVNYAAEDALVGIQVLLCLLRDLNPPSRVSLPPVRLGNWEGLTAKSVRETCFPFRELKFMQRKSG